MKLVVAATDNSQLDLDKLSKSEILDQHTPRLRCGKVSIYEQELGEVVSEAIVFPGEGEQRIIALDPPTEELLSLIADGLLAGNLWDINACQSVWWLA